MISNDRTHHPSCAATQGGLCTGCPTSERTPVVAAPARHRVTCSHGEALMVTGDNPEALYAAEGCPCVEEVAS